MTSSRDGNVRRGDREDCHCKDVSTGISWKEGCMRTPDPSRTLPCVRDMVHCRHRLVIVLLNIGKVGSMRTMLGMFAYGSCCLRHSLAAKRCLTECPLVKWWWLESPICVKLLPLWWGSGLGWWAIHVYVQDSVDERGLGWQWWGYKRRGRRDV